MTIAWRFTIAAAALLLPLSVAARAQDELLKDVRSLPPHVHSTGLIGKLSQPGGSLYGIEHSNDGLITFPGGLPIVDKDGVMIGAVGVSGSSVENDYAVCEAGVLTLGVADLPEHPWRT